MKKLAAPAFLVAMGIVFAIVAAWTPLQGDDWGHRVWASHPDHSFIAANYQFADLVGYVLAVAPWSHVIVAPVAALALVIGIFVLAQGRRPRATYDDALALALISALLWIGGPRAGVVWFHRPFVAADVCGVAAAVWLVAPLRCGWTVRPALWPLIAVGGYCVGTSTRTIGLATLIGAVLVLRKRQYERWHRVLIGALVVGNIVGFISPPWFELWRVVKRGLDPNLTLLNLPLHEGGEVISLVLVLVLANAGLAALGRSHAADGDRPAADHGWRWFFAWFGIAVLALFGPRYSEATLVPATAALAVGAIPYLMWLCRHRLLRGLLAAFAVGVNLVAWTFALTTYSAFGAEGAARLALLEHAAPGTIVTVPPYSQILPTFWVFGEDFAGAGPRQLIATAAFGLRDIVVDPPFRRYEPNPRIDVTLDVEGVSDADLRAADPPAIWASEPSTCRYQFTRFAKRLRARVPGAGAVLRVTNVRFDADARPLIVAQLARGKILAPAVTRASPDANDRYAYTVHGDARLDTAWIVSDGTQVKLDYRGGHPSIQPLVAGLQVLVLCNAQVCVVADAFVPRF